MTARGLISSARHTHIAGSRVAGCAFSAAVMSWVPSALFRSQVPYWAVPTLGDGECYGCPPTARLRGWSVCDLGSYPTLQPLIRTRSAATSAALLTTSR